MARDVAGVSRANQFETLHASSGVHFTPVRGTATHITYQPSDGGEPLRVSSHRRTGDELEHLRRMMAEYPESYR